MIRENLYLEEFLQNSGKARAELVANSEIVVEIERKLASEEGWDRGTFIKLVPGKFGLKKREYDETVVETTSIADLYSPELEISPFVILYEGEGGLAYVVKDFGPIGPALDTYQKYEPIRNAIRHMIKRGYGVSANSNPKNFEDVESLIDTRVPSMRNLFGNIFLFDGQEKWAMVDFDFTGTLINYQEIYEGANEGKGNFARLNSIWKRLDSPDYKIS